MLDPMRFFFSLLPVLAGFLIGPLAWAHPLPDVPVRAVFEESGDVSIHVEIDPRCFEEDPNVAPYVTNADLPFFKEDKQAQLKQKAADYVAAAVEFIYDPTGPFKPEFEWTFTTLDGAELKAPEDPVMITGAWKGKFGEDVKAYRIRALNYRTLSVLFQNRVRGKDVGRLQVLFPGEDSFPLDIRTGHALVDAPPVIVAKDEVPSDASDPMLSFIDQKTLLIAAVLAVLVFIVRWSQRRQKGQSKAG
ncbi:MAG: hypothetical protein H7A55_05005 [Verrucomicrobiaceae bacterium]|nr:hypothetical protein [Verrucomicrobiaceae bacterium]